MYFEIGNDLVNSSFDFFGGGGFKLADGEIDGQPVNLIEKAKENGFGYVNNVDDFLALNKEAGRVIAVPNPVTESGAMNYVIDMGQTEVHLGDLTAKAIEMLDNENGFFMMKEARLTGPAIPMTRQQLFMKSLISLRLLMWLSLFMISTRMKP